MMPESDSLASRDGARAKAVAAACAHCGLPVPAGLVEAGAERQFCCAGCRAVWETLHACGLDAYYRLREAAADEAVVRPASPKGAAFEEFDSEAFEAAFVQDRGDGVRVADLVLEGVSCAACVWLVERLPRVVEGVVEARLSLREATVRIAWDPRAVKLSKVARTLDRLGYTPHPARGRSARDVHRREMRRRLIHLGAAGALMGNTMLLALALYSGEASGQMERQYETFFRWLSLLLGGTALAWPGATFFRSAWAAVRMRAVNLDVPIALALLAGGAAGVVNVVLGRGEIYFDSLTVLVFLLLVGRFIQYAQQRRADDAVGLLFSLTPSTCHVVRDGAVEDAPVEALRGGDLVEVRPGELFPADGRVEAGRSTVNAALLTGESMPVAVEAGADVHAGSQNVSGVLRVRVDKVGAETRVGRLMGLIERGVREKPPIVQFADRVGTWFTGAVSVLAAAIFAFWSWAGPTAAAIDHAVAFLIVTCPCVLGLATPLTLAITIGRLARRDVLVKSAAAVEKLARGGRLLLDKTGTLTEGRMLVWKWVGDEDLRGLAAAVERRSNHPVGRALAEAIGAAAEEGHEVADVAEAGDGGISATVDGRGVRIGSPSHMARHGVEVSSALACNVTEMEQEGATAVLVAIDGVAVAAAGLGDRIRPDGAAAVARLRQLGWRPAVLSGDAEDVVRHVARRVGIPTDDAEGRLTPEEKLERVKAHADPERDGAGGVNVMVGDGVNDAAALAAADVGIAVHGGAEASLSAADVYVARPGLTPLVELVELSRRAMATVRRNLAVSLGYNVLAGTLAAAGMMSPLIAAVIMPVSSATVLALAAASVTRAARRVGGGGGGDGDAALPAMPRPRAVVDAAARGALLETSHAPAGGSSWK